MQLAPATSGLDALVASGDLPGYAVAVRHRDEVAVAAGGRADLASDRAAAPDTVWRIASLSKPVAAILVGQLVDEGALATREPVARWVPELADVRVLARPDAPLEDTVGLARPLTLHDLLTMTSGLGVGAAPSAVDGAMEAAGLAPGPLAPAMSGGEAMARLGTIPLASQPGEAFRYHTSTDVLTVLIERVTGESASSLVAHRIGDPLDLPDLAFGCADEQRLATAYHRPEGHWDALARGGGPELPPFCSLGGGLVGTATDIVRVLDEILRPRTMSAGRAESIRTAQLGDSQRASAGMFLPEGTSYGQQVAVATADRPRRGHRGTFGWSGGTGCVAQCDPVSDVTAVLLTNAAMDSPEEPAAFTAFLDGLAEVVDLT